MQKNYQHADECPIRLFMESFSGKWKPIIIWLLSNQKTMRFSELDKAMAGISQKVLSSQLRELEEIGIIEKTIYPTVPPKVEYYLATKGQTLMPLFDEIKQWVNQHLQR